MIIKANKTIKTIMQAMLIMSLVGALLFIVRYSINIPIADQWAIIKHIDRIDISYLWAQHNEHRILFPKLIFFFLAKMTHWNISYEVLLNWALFTAFICFLYYSLIVANKENKKNQTRDFIIIGILAVLSTPIHYQNWLWGFQIQINLTVLASIICFYLVAGLAKDAQSPIVLFWRTTASTLFMFIACYSFFSGLITAFTVLSMSLYLLLSRKNPLSSGVMAVFAVMSILLYLHGYSFQKGVDAVPSIWGAIIFVPIYLGVVFSSARVGASMFYMKAAEYVAMIVGVVLLLLSGRALLVIVKISCGLTLRAYCMLSP